MASYPRDVNLLSKKAYGSPRPKALAVIAGLSILALAALVAVAVPSAAQSAKRAEYDRLSIERERYGSSELAQLLPVRLELLGREEELAALGGLPALGLLNAVTAALPRGGELTGFVIAENTLALTVRIGDDSLATPYAEALRGCGMFESVGIVSLSAGQGFCDIELTAGLMPREEASE